MFLARRLSVAVAFLCFPLVALADEIPSWAAPPYWSLLATVPKPEKVGSDVAQIGVESAESVPTPPLALIGINPCRIVDTRGNGFTGAYGPPALTQGSPRNFTLTGQCGIPGSAQAVSLNVTVTNTQGPGFILIYPQGGAQPGVSTLNYVAGQTIANAAVVPLGTAGGITVIAGVSGTDLIIDTNGYYAPQTVVNTVNGLSGDLTLAAGSNISITPSGQTLTVANTAPAAWRLTGNAGTTPGTNYIGTSDNQALELKVNGERALRLETDPFPGTYGPNIIGGFLGNFVSGGLVGATIGGGGQTGLVNRVTADFGTVGGGWNNNAAGYASFVAAGRDNTAAGGYSTVPGGSTNRANGLYSFAAGRRAVASHAGVFVWGDSTDADVDSTGADQFIVRAAGGFRFIVGNVLCELTGVTGWDCVSPSDRNLKRDVVPVDGRDALARLVAMPIQTWSYSDQSPEVRHMGPMAQDFAGAYALGADDRKINPLDANGVALAAIQGLYAVVEEKEREIEELKARLSKLEDRFDQ